MSTARDDQGDKTCLEAMKPLLATTMTTTTLTTPISSTTTTATAKNLSPQPPANRNKFTLDEVGEQLRSIRKLSETSDFLSSNAIELNNNTILASSSPAPPPPLQEAQQYLQPLKSQQQQFVAGNPRTLNQLRMDIRRSGEVAGNQEPQTGTQPAPYTSLFSPTFGRDTSSSSRQSTPASHLQPSTRQPQLRKQSAALDLDLSTAAVNRLPVQQVPIKKMGAYASSPGQQKEVSSASSTTTTTTQEDEEEVEEEDLDERLPFNANHLPKLGSGRKVTSSSSPSRKRSSTSPARSATKHQHSVISFDNKCEYVKRNSSSTNINNTKGSNKKNISSKHHQQQARISLVDSRPPSFSACQPQPGYIHLNNNKEILAGRKLDWQHHHQQQQTFARCDCSNCHKKFSSLALESSANYQSGLIPQPASSKYPKTYSMHMVLKSIILILVTLLLSMLFLGVIMATHYMPHAIERLLNTPRTFNVTIATG